MGISHGIAAPVDELILQNEKKKEQQKRLQIDWSFQSKGVSFSEGPDESQMVQFGVRPYLQANLHRIFSMEADASINLSAGRVQARFSDPTLEDLTLNHVSINLKPIKQILLQAGALNQDHLGSQLVVSSRAFPAAMGSLIFQNKKFIFSARVQGAVPTSTSLEVDRTEKEELPSLLTTGIEAKAKPFKGAAVGLGLTAFDFGELPSTVAFESGRRGNSVLGNVRGDSAFENDFRGNIYSGFARYKLTKRFWTRLGYSFVLNDDAVENEGRGEQVGISVSFKLADATITPMYSYFFAEPNVAPALYGSSSIGHTNREGDLFGARVKFKYFAIEGQYVDSKLINESSSQDDLQSFSLKVETTYDFF